MFSKLTACRCLYFLCLVGVLLLFGLQLRTGGWLQTDLRSLLPKESQWNELQFEADLRQEQQLNRRLLVLIGHRESVKAFELAEQTAQNWQASGLFSSIFYQTNLDLAQLQNEIVRLRFATLPTQIRQQLIERPTDYFKHYAEQIVNPFQQQNLLSIEQDWLGFGRFALEHIGHSLLSWHVENGMLFVEKEGITWVLIQAELSEASLINPDVSLLTLLSEGRQQVSVQQGQLLAAGPSLFAAYSKQQAEYESLWMSVSGMSLTLLFLLIVFRSLRVLWLFLPIGIGMLFGVVATVAVFGQIHILTLVIGTSLIGVLIDFPLHWLSTSLFTSKWDGRMAMIKLHFTFLISLFVTLLGYLLLGFTPLVVLQQTALFSGVALIAALMATVCFLPLFFTHYSARASINPQFKPIQFYQKFLSFDGAFIRNLFLILILMGIAQTRWQDDIRDWVALPEPLLAEARQVAQIAGVELGSQYFLVIAENDEMLLRKEQGLSRLLFLLQQQGKIGSFQSLSQWIMSVSEQQVLAKRVSQIPETDYIILTELGIEAEMIKQALKELREQEPITLQAALSTEVGKALQPFYLGPIGYGQVGSIVKLHGLQDVTEIISLGNSEDIFWQDKRTALNRAFEQSRNQAAWLKLVSFGLAGLLLWRFFGLRSTSKMLFAPLGGIAITLSIFGWLGIPISLFMMFGLLLVSAISIDYTAYMQTANEPIYAKRIAISLATVTTLISFIILSFSATPAVSIFGLSVSLGVIFSVLITFKMFK